jgi:hypothetical protein
LIFRKKRKPVREEPEKLLLEGDWLSNIWDRRPVEVPAHLDVEAFLEQRPMPSLWPEVLDFNAHVDDEVFNSHFGGRDQFLCTRWLMVLLHHPDPAVLVQGLRSRYLEGATHVESVTDLLVVAPVAELAAEAIWRMDDSDVRQSLNIVREECGLPADASPGPRWDRVWGLLRSTCPPHRRAWLMGEIGP